jgi:DNA-binding MurR/RpiR family transcriptional regulator
MDRIPTFDERVADGLARLSPAERQVVTFFQEHRDEVLLASALALAEKIGTSDATVIRATKALGYASLDELRRALATELRRDLSPASRLTRTLDAVGQKTVSILDLTLDIHEQALARLRRDISPALFQAAVDRLAAARRVFIFGIGPSQSMADYFAVQLARFGIDSIALTQTGLLLADGLHRLKQGDALVILAYSRSYRELEAVLDRAGSLGMPTILLTDTLGPALRERVDLVLPVARGRADWFSMHTATLALIEALLVGVAAARPAETIDNLELLNSLRAKLGGEAMALAIGDRRVAPAGRRKRRAHK